MSLSNFAKDVVNKVLDAVGVDVPNTATYSITMSDGRENPTAMTASFKFRKPLKESYIEAKMPKFADLLGDYLSSNNLGVLDGVLKKYGLDSGKMGSSTKVSGSLPFDVIDEDVPTGDELTSIRGKSGRMISIGNFKSLLNISMKSYMMAHMTEGGPQLQNRTGRFITSSEVESVRVFRTGIGNNYILMVSFNYMKYPYETFDPAGPNSRGLASPARNPRRIIGDAITKAVDDLVNMQFYTLEVSQL